MLTRVLLNSSPLARMNKQTSINTTLTALANRSFAEEVMGKTFTPVQDRWSPGALLSSLFAVSVAPMFAVFGSNQVLAYDSSDIANANIASSIDGGLSEDPTSIAAISFAAEVSTSKSKVITVAGVSVSIAPVGLPVNEDAADIVSGVLLPVPPTYTILSLANKLESLALATGKGYLVTVNQETEVATVYLFADSAAADAALAAVRIVADGVIKVAFDTPIAAIQPSSPKFGWE